MKKKKGKIEITDKELEQAIIDRLNADPVHYLNFLRALIDKISGDISDEILFESLKPAFTQNPTLEEILSGQKRSSNINYSPIPSSKSVDMLFYPAVRKKLKEWQQTFFDKESTDSQKLKAETNLQKVFKRLLYRQGRQKDLSSEVKRQIRSCFNNIDRKCRDIFKKTKHSISNRKLTIKENFPDIGEQIINQLLLSNSPAPEKLRNEVLAKRHGVSVRTIEECIREFQLIKVSKLQSDPKIQFITIKGSGKKAKISVDKKSQ